ncbi:MAG: hypothetical protein MUF02_01450 [Acidobacteria bacterium]|jgi:hypothetical protein|nr:hypothetical protein [Acidobacteriota bacterium]
MDANKGNVFFNARSWRLWLPGRCGGLPLLFLLFICLPLLNRVFSFVGPYELDEKRKLAEKPAFDLRRPFLFAREYEEYYNDHFTFRTRWVHWNNLLTYKVFGTSASPHVVIGKQGWLFLGNINPYFDEIDYYRNLKPFTFGELRYWQVLLEERRDWLKRRGIHYLFTVAPNKSTVYPEFMPDWVRKVNPRSRLDQLIAHMKKYSTLRVLDLRPALAAAKTIRPPYYQSDTHWNDWGGYVAYREIITYWRRHFPQARPRPLEAFTFQQSEFRSGDLALMLSLPDLFRENQWQLASRTPLQARVVSASGPEARKNFPAYTLHTCAGGSMPAALLVHDSFAHFMKQFLSEDFAKIVYVMNWQLNFFDQIIEREGIRIVMDEMVEYSLLNRFPSNPAKLRK